MNILVNDFVTGVLVFVRVLSMIVIAPIFNNDSLPKFAKAIIALAVAFMIFLTIPKVQIEADISLIFLFFMGIKEVLTGLIMGYTLNFVFYGLSLAGYFLSREIGLMMANMFDPNSQAQDNIMGVLLVFMGTIIFLIIGGHRFILESLAYSFKIIPIGKMTFSGTITELFIKYSASVFVIAIKIASPLIVAFFFVHISAGIIARVSPSFQVFFVLLPLKLGLGLFLMVLMIPVFAYVFRDLLFLYEDKLLEILRVMAQ